MSSYTRIVLVVVLAFLAANCQEDKPQLDLTIEGQQVIPEGQSITIVCTITNNIVGGFLRWEKVYNTEDGTTATVAIGTNGKIEKEYQGLQTEAGERRYTASMQQVEQTRNYIAKLMFKEVKAEDGGRYSCALPSVDGLSQSVDITVEVQPSYMEFHVSKNSEPIAFEDEQELEFEKEDKLALSCIVKGGHPAAEVTVTIGDKDITDLFEKELMANQEYMEPRGLVKTTHDVTLTLKEDLTIDYKHSGQEVACHARLPGREVTKSSSFKVKMSGVPPIFECDDVVYSNSYMDNVNITCRVRAEPMVTEAYVYFYMHGNPEKNIVRAGEELADTLEMKEIEKDEEKPEAVLTIIFPRLFGNFFRNYTFVATSEVGSSEHTVKLAIDSANAQDPWEENKVTGSTSQNGLTIDLTLSQKTAYPGDNLEAVCTVKMGKMDRIVVEWLKKTWDPAKPNQPIVDQIAVNLHVNKHFQNDRFTASAVVDQETAVYTFTLKITDVRTEDSGEIGCAIQTQNFEILHNFTVFAPITSLELVSEKPSESPFAYENGSTVIFEEGQKMKFYCRAKGGNPAAQMEMVSGKKNITDRFQRKVTLRKEEGLMDVSLEADEFVVEYPLYKKWLGCKASIPGSRFEEQSIGFTVNLTGFKPKFLCNSTILVELNEADFNISCIVRSLPPIDGGSIGWQMLDNQNQTMAMGSRDGHYKTDPLPPHDMAMVSCMNMTDPRLSLNDSEPEPPAPAPAQKSPNSPNTTCVWPVEIQQGDSDEEMVMVLRIDRIFIQHFRKYFFTAANAIGEVTHTVELIQVKTGSSTDEATSHMTASIATIILTALATQFL